MVIRWSRNMKMKKDMYSNIIMGHAIGYVRYVCYDKVHMQFTNVRILAAFASHKQRSIRFERLKIAHVCFRAIPAIDTLA